MKHLTVLTGASRGLGAALAEALLNSTSHVVGISRHANHNLTALAQSRAATWEEWSEDLSEPLAVASRLSDWLASLDGGSFASVTLINNAAVLPELVPLRATQPASLVQAMRINLEAPLVLCAAFLAGTTNWACPRKVLNISSGLGRRAMASSSAYCAAKAGMDLFTQCVALEESEHPNGARVCSLAPGVIDTDMQVKLRHADADQFPDLQAFQALHQQGQLTRASQAAQRVLQFLARPDFGDRHIADVRA